MAPWAARGPTAVAHRPLGSDAHTRRRERPPLGRSGREGPRRGRPAREAHDATIKTPRRSRVEWKRSIASTKAER